MFAKEKFTAYTMKPDLSDGFCMAFAVKKYELGDNGKFVDGAVVLLVDVLLLDNENGTTQNTHHHNHGYAMKIFSVVR